MCGICGKMIWKNGEINEEAMRRMLAALVHRGPDDEGIYTKRCGETSIALGHRRLSIIDLSAADVSLWPTRTVPCRSSATARSTTTGSCGRNCSNRGTVSAPCRTRR